MLLQPPDPPTAVEPCLLVMPALVLGVPVTGPAIDV